MHLIAAALVAFLGPAPPRAPRRVPLVTCVTRADEHGNFVLRPPGDARPRALVHFLGGAFVGAAPHLTYATLLQTLADAGYIVVATPYELRFDHLALCDDVVERAQPTLLRLQAEHAESAVGDAAPHAGLPIVGVGHSCGALLLLLLGSFFRGAASDLPPYAANALMSYNNNLASESIPLLRTVVTPLAAGILATRSDVLPSTARAAFSQARTQLSSIAQLYDADADRARFPGSPPSVQEAAALADGLLPIIDQIEPLFEAISSGRAEFTPRPAEVLTAAPMLYATGSTLLLRFDDDEIDQTPTIAAALDASDARTVTSQTLSGTHLTPLAPELLRLLPVPAPPRALEELARAVASTEGFGADLSPLFASSPDRQFGEAAGAVLAFIDEALAREAGQAEAVG